MSEEWKGYYGKDGKRYKDAVELWRANAVVENQEEQTRLLKMNAELSLLQAEQEERKMQQAKDIENERREHEKQMEQTKFEHEKELLLLKKFDEISIPLEVYKKFEENLLKSYNVKPEKAEQYNNFIKSATELISKKAKDSEKFGEVLQSNMNYPNNEVKYTDKYKKLEEFINSKYSTIMLNMETKDFDIIDNKQEFIEIFNREKKYTKQSENIYSFLAPLNIILGIIEFIAASIISSARSILILVGTVQLCSGLLVKFIHKIPDSRATKDLKVELNKAINSQMVNEYSQDNISEEEKSINEELKKLQAEINESSKTIIDKRLQDLYNFRLEHFNLKIEKLFYDVGLVNKCMEKNYKWLDIDKKNIKSEGTYEDYFHYFNNYNPNNEEPQVE